MVAFGWIKDKPDIRDYDARKLIYKEVPLPKAYLVDSNTLIYNQGNIPQCVAASSCGVKTDEEFTERSQRIWFDMNWLYSECKKIDGIPNTEGTFPRIALQVIQSQGMKRLGVCRKPDFSFKIDSYYRIDSLFTIVEVKQIIAQYGSILSASQWPDNWMNISSDGILPSPIITVNSGGHAYRIDGWDDDVNGFILINSWGTSWAKKGTAIMPYDVFTSLPLAGGDVWKLVDHLGLK